MTTITDAATADRRRPALARREPARRRARRAPARRDDRSRRRPACFFQTMITMGEDGELAEATRCSGCRRTASTCIGKGMTHFNLLGVAPTAGAIAALAQQAAGARGIDPPRHPRDDLDRSAPLVHRQPRHGACSRARSRSGPRPSGLAATRDAALVERFADIARQEYTAVGIRVALHPQVDLATEPRWARASADLRRGRRARRASSAPPTSAASRAAIVRPGSRLDDDQALPRRRPAEGRRRPALRLRPRAGLPGRPVRAST